MDPRDAPPGVDPEQSSVARVYDYLLGGKYHYEIDRQVAEQVARTMPDVAALARVNRHLLTRVCRFLSHHTGIKQFLDIGCGMPGTENVHEIVQRADPQTKVLYVDYDPVVAAHARAMLDENEFTEFVQGDVFDPVSILEQATVSEHLDWDEPIALLFMAVLHHDGGGDRGRAAAATQVLIDQLPSGSYVAISHLLDPADGSEDDRTVAEVLDVVHGTSMKDVTARTRAEIKELFHGTELIPSGPNQPADIELAARWWPDGPPGDLSVAERILAAGVAKKP
ncbi:MULTISPECIES: SAM-dependent methyltransferase [Actinomycetes]|uniref:SAM-dependent methyltransferase n=1 Tax=Actinomycetes TaxID=1760 RepID=UPI0001B55C1E|nr:MULTISPECIES: SAM-dependent methyltransferase [Actinomycetes]EFL12488.1 predicted protein [Streptomyces sp. AA4]